jgi:Terminase DNA packaging enzyme
MSKIDDNLSEILNIEPVKKQEVVPVQVEPQNDTQTDYDLSRQTIRNLVRKGEEALDELLFVAKQSESPRAYEVVAGMIKNISEVTKELIDLQKKMKELNEENPKSSSGVNVQNAVFVGSTAELQKLLRQNKEQQTDG